MTYYFSTNSSRNHRDLLNDFFYGLVSYIERHLEWEKKIPGGGKYADHNLN